MLTVVGSSIPTILVFAATEVPYVANHDVPTHRYVSPNSDVASTSSSRSEMSAYVHDLRDPSADVSDLDNLVRELLTCL